jgi:hypothetical protein
MAAAMAPHWRARGRTARNLITGLPVGLVRDGSATLGSPASSANLGRYLTIRPRSPPESKGPSRQPVATGPSSSTRDPSRTILAFEVDHIDRWPGGLDRSR